MLSSLNPRHCETVNDLSGAKLWSNPLNTDRSLNIRFLAGPREDGSGAKGISIHIKGKLTLTNQSLQNTQIHACHLAYIHSFAKLNKQTLRVLFISDDSSTIT